MSAGDIRKKNQSMAAHLIATGYPHGRRRSKGLSNIPSPTDVGSAAYRRLLAKRRTNAR